MSVLLNYTHHPTRYHSHLFYSMNTIYRRLVHRREIKDNRDSNLLTEIFSLNDVCDHVQKYF